MWRLAVESTIEAMKSLCSSRYHDAILLSTQHTGCIERFTSLEYGGCQRIVVCNDRLATAFATIAVGFRVQYSTPVPVSRTRCFASAVRATSKTHRDCNKNHGCPVLACVSVQRARTQYNLCSYTRFNRWTEHRSADDIVSTEADGGGTGEDVAPALPVGGIIRVWHDRASGARLSGVGDIRRTFFIGGHHDELTRVHPEHSAERVQSNVTQPQRWDVMPTLEYTM